MRALRKGLFIAVVLAVILLLTPVAWGAVSVVRNPFTDAVGHTYERELALMAALGIMRGDTGTTNVRPDHPITRAEFTAVVIRMLDREQQAAQLGTIQPTFRDQIASWAWGYVNLATHLGIIRGYDDGTFQPTRNVTHTECLAMLIRATGHEPGVVGDWPFNYLVAGYEHGITGQVQVFANLPATRGEVAHFVYNALFIKRGKGVGTAYNPEGLPPLLGDRTFAGIAGVYDAGAKTLVIGGTARNLADRVHLWRWGTLAELRGSEVRAIAAANGRIVFIEPHAAADLVRGIFDRYEGSSAAAKLVLADGTRVSYTPGTTRLSVNDGPERALAHNDAVLKQGDQVTISTSAGKAVTVSAFRFNLNNAVVTEKHEATSTQPVRVRLDSGELVGVPEDAGVVLNGATVRPADLRVNDVVYIATRDASATQSAVKVEAVRQTVSGTFLSDRRVYTEPTKFDWYIRLRLTDGSERELKWYTQFTPASPPPAITPGTALIYALDRSLHARKALTAVATVAHGKLLGVATIPGSTKAQVTLDVRGTSTNYVAAIGTAATWAADIGWVGEFGINPASGEIDAWTRRWKTTSGLTLGQVHSLDASGVMVQVYDAGTGSLSPVFRVSHPDMVAYREDADGTVGTFQATSGLTAGTRVYFALHLDGRIIFILRKHNQNTW